MRFMDRAVGVVALQLLAAGRRRKPLPYDPQRIGVIIPTAIGDTILSSGVLSALVDRYPRADLLVFHGESNASAVRLLPMRMTRIECPFTNPAAAIDLLRRKRLDMVVDLTPWTRITAIYACLAAPVSVGFDPPGQHRGAAFDIAVRHRADAHEIDNHADLAALFSGQPYRMNVVTEKFDALEGMKLERLVLCHSCAGGSRAADKAWPVESWAELARRLVSEGWQVGFTGTPADASLVQTILAKATLPSTQVFSLCGKASLAQLGDLIQRARLLITIDTGVLHLGAAVDAKILALHGPTRSSRWGARTANATSLNSAHPAAGYMLYGYEAHPQGRETMLAHTVDNVANAAFVKLAQSTSS